MIMIMTTKVMLTMNIDDYENDDNNDENNNHNYMMLI